MGHVEEPGRGERPDQPANQVGDQRGWLTDHGREWLTEDATPVLCHLESINGPHHDLSVARDPNGQRWWRCTECDGPTTWRTE